MKEIRSPSLTLETVNWLPESLAALDSSGQGGRVRGEAANGSTVNNTLGKGAGGGSGGSVLVLVGGDLWGR